MSTVQASAGHERFSADHARQYDERIRVIIPGYELLHRLSAAALRDRLADDADLLIVGAGTGAEVLLLGQLYPGWRFTAIDPAADMIAIARDRCAAAGLGERVELIVATTDQLPNSDRYDAATALLVMHFLPDDGAKLDFLRHISDRLVPGAPFVIADLHGDHTADGFSRVLRIWQRYQLDLGVPEEKTVEMAQQVLEHIQWATESRLRDLFRSAGFAEVDLYFRGALFGAWSMRKTTSS